MNPGSHRSPWDAAPRRGARPAAQVPKAVGHRAATYTVGVLSPVEPGAEQTVHSTHRAVLDPFAADVIGQSLNFSYSPLDADRRRAAFAPEDLRKLADLAARLDPEGRLHGNHPITRLPAALG